jgi:hypothetical protein
MGMGKRISTKVFLKLSPFLLSVPLLVSLTMSPVSANANSGGDQTDTATETLIRHMNLMVEKFPEMEGKKAQVQEQLSNGKMPHEACSHCHIKGESHGSAGQ